MLAKIVVKISYMKRILDALLSAGEDTGRHRTEEEGLKGDVILSLFAGSPSETGS